MKKLLFFGSDYNVGLTTALTEQILELQQLPGLELTVLSSENEMEPGLQEQLRHAGVFVKLVPGLDEHQNFTRLAAVIGDTISERAIELVNVHNNWQLALVIGVRLGPWAKRSFKTIYTIHGYRHNSPWKSWLAILIIGGALRLFADRVISMSGFVSKKFWFLRDKTDVVYYIMKKPEFNKTENQLSTAELRLVFPAQFRPGKNQERLIPVIADYISATGDTSIRVWLPGAGETLSRCCELVHSLGLDEQVIFPGRLSHREVIALYEQANIGLAMTNIETYGRCIAEPFALGRCVISRRTGIAEDIIRQGENGFLFNTEAELLAILLELHDHPERIAGCGNQAFADKAMFSAQAVMTSYLQVLDKAMAK